MEINGAGQYIVRRMKDDYNYGYDSYYSYETIAVFEKEEEALEFLQERQTKI